MDGRALVGIDVNLLVVLDALLAEGRVERAAKRVGLSPSAMSHALARLRALLDDPILVRAGRQMVPTARAQALAPALREGLATLARALDRAPALDLASVRRPVRIAMVDFAQQLLVPKLARRVRTAAPGLDLVVLPTAPGSDEALPGGELDLVIAAHRSPRGLRSRLLHEEPFVSIVRRGHPLLAARITARRFAACDHVLISPRGRSPGAVDEALARRGLGRRVALVVPSAAAAVAAVADSDLVLTAGERSFRAWGEALALTSFAPPIAIAPYRLGMVWHERQEHDPVLAWVREQVARSVGD